MRIPIHQVDAFTHTVFGGNPAAVCCLPRWLGDDLLRSIAAENNLSETAFLVPDRDPVPLRWFAPAGEVPLCGHATLAAGFVALNHLFPERSSVAFDSPAGVLTVSREGSELAVRLPAVRTSVLGEPPIALGKGLPVEPTEVLVSRADPNYLVIVETADQVRSVRPDLQALESLHPYGVAISAPGGAVDFVSRYFAPGYGIPEDPVTGSIHCALGPYWAGRLGKGSLRARQLSARGGELGVRVEDDGVLLTGGAVRYLDGEIHLG
ncbi:MAG: PhzF family phenazine biosynthesis protein [Gemmatimonadota bacterium]|jgi:PhzF family phenazine biosynthesis protein